MRVLSAISAFFLAGNLLAQPICGELNAGFTYSVTGSTVQFTNATIGQGVQTTYQWTYGDGTTANAPNPSHTYASAGVYEACLFVITFYLNGGGIPTTCVDSACVNITIGGGNICDELEAGFAWTNTPNGTQFSNATTGTGFQTTWSWTFGDGGTSNDPQPFHAYAEPGVYEVCLVVVSVYETASGGVVTCTDEFCDEVIIGGTDPCDGLDASFWTGNNGGNPASIFYSASTGIGPNWIWSFGDGTSSDDGPQGTHTYAAAGTYTICLTVWAWIPGTQDTCSVTSCQTITIGGGEPCDDFAVEFESNTTPNGTQFTTTMFGGSPQTTYAWSFGDGSDGSGPNPFHTYAAAGTYLVCVTATSVLEVNGQLFTCVDEFCDEVTIGGGGNICDELEAGFAAFITGMGVNFSNTTTGTGFQTTWSWTFGDGSTSNDPQPLHTYAEPGVYGVCLVVVSSYETGTGVITCTDEFCDEVVIGGGGNICDELEAGFAWTNTPNGTQFSNATTGTGFQTTWSWTFGDGGTSNDPQPFHAYTEPGVYEVCLVVVSVYETASGGVVTCTDGFCDEVIIGGTDPCDGLDASFWTGNNGGNPASIFYSASTGIGPNWIWSFGDGTSSDDGPQGTHTYAAAGTYTICLTVWAWIPGTQDTCSVTSCQTITIGGGNICDELEAGFAWTTTPNGTQFSNATTGTGLQTTWSWTFGDGSTSNDPQPLHTYAEPGVYEVCLVAISMYETSAGVVTCTDEFCDEVIIGGGGNICDELEAGFAWTNTPNGTQFSNATTGTGFQTTWSWTFGDGGTSNDPQPFHAYTEPGVYEVCLVVVSVYETSSGVITCTDEYCDEVIIGGCEPFEIDFTYATQGVATLFQASSSVPVVGYLWFFGNGTDGTGQVITHLFEPPGPFNVCLAAWYWNSNTQDTCWAEHCELIDPFGVGVDELDFGYVTMYPNPATDVLIIEGLPVGAEARLYSAEGRFLIQQRASGQRLVVGVSDLAPAIYSVELRTPDGSQWRRVAIE